MGFDCAIFSVTQEDILAACNAHLVKEILEDAEGYLCTNVDSLILDNLSDVNAAPPTESDSIRYNSGAMTWDFDQYLRRMENKFIYTYYDRDTFVVEDFDEGNTVLKYAGYPFVGVPSVIDTDEWSIVRLKVSNYDGVAKAFLYQDCAFTTPTPSDYTFAVRVKGGENIDFIGIRVDDGTDDNYFEIGVGEDDLAAYGGLAKITHGRNYTAGAPATTTPFRTGFVTDWYTFSVTFQAGLNTALSFYSNNSPSPFLLSTVNFGAATTFRRAGLVIKQAGSTRAFGACDWFGKST